MTTPNKAQHTPAEERIADQLPDPRETARRIHRQAVALQHGEGLSYAAAKNKVERTETKTTSLDVQGVLDWAETILCNSLPMSHCSQAEWDDIIHQWLDAKHGLASTKAEGRAQ